MPNIEPEDVVNISSSDTEEALELLSLGSGHGALARPSVDNTREFLPSSSAGSDWFEDWREVNDVAAGMHGAVKLPSNGGECCSSGD
jgi:hypothetical protein